MKVDTRSEGRQAEDIEHKAFNKRLDDIEAKLEEVLMLLRVGKAGIAFLKFITLVGASLAAIWTAMVELPQHWKGH